MPLSDPVYGAIWEGEGFTTHPPSTASETVDQTEFVRPRDVMHAYCTGTVRDRGKGSATHAPSTASETADENGVYGLKTQ